MSDLQAVAGGMSTGYLDDAGNSFQALFSSSIRGIDLDIYGNLVLVDA